jgi:hypothetical protein
MLGVVPVVCWTRPNETGDGYVARVEARTLDGRVVGAAESECSRAERKWKTSDPFAIRSMAQTRAIGRALRAPLGQIVVLADYEPTGAEEIAAVDAETPTTVGPAESSRSPVPEEAKPTREQIARMRDLVVKLAAAEPGTDWRARCRELAGVPGDMLTRGGAMGLVRQLEEALSR